MDEADQWADICCQVSYAASKRWAHAETLWLSALVDGDSVVVTHPSFGGQLYLILGLVAGKVALGWPLEKVGPRGDSPYKLQTDIDCDHIKDIMVDELAEWESAEGKWLSPATCYSQKHVASGLMMRVPQMRPILQTAASAAFWNLTVTTLTDIAGHIGADMGERTLFAVLKCLVEKVLPDHTPSQVAEVLSRRCPKVDPLLQFIESDECADHLEAMGKYDKASADKEKELAENDREVANLFMHSYRDLLDKVAPAPKAKAKLSKTDKQKRERLARGPMFSKTSSAAELAEFLPEVPGRAYKVSHDNYNGRWYITAGPRYVASYTWLKYGYVQAAEHLVRAAWRDASEPCPWDK